MSHDVTKNTLYLTLASVGQKLIAFVYFLFLARVLEPEQTGVYFLSVSLAMVFSVIADLGVTPVTIREIAKQPSQTVLLVRKTLVAKIPLIVMGFLATIASVLLLGYDRQILVLASIAAVSLMLDSIHLLFYGVLRSHQYLKIEALGMFGGQIVVGTVGGVLLWLHPSLFALTAVLVLASAFNVTLSALSLWRKFGADLFLPVFDRSFLKALFRQALPFALAALFVKVYSYVDTIFLSKFLDTTSVGLYSIAYKFTYAFQFIPLAFTAALYPKFSWSLVHERDDLPRLFRRAIWYLTLIVVPLTLGLSLVSGQAVMLAGASYEQAGPILSVLIFALVPIFLDFPIGSLLNAAGKQATKTAIMGLTMVVNVLLNLFLIPRYGTMGAAMAAVGSFSLLFAMGLWFVKTVLPDFRWNILILDMLKICVSGLIMYSVGFFLLPLIGWIAVIPVCAIVYLSGVFLTRAVTKQDLILLNVFGKKQV